MAKLRNIALFLLLFPLCGWAQDGDRLPLVDILAQIGNTNGTRFSYIDEELAVYAMIPPDEKLPLEAKLQYIEQRTKLRFAAITENYYTVYNDRRMDKPLCGYLLDSQTGRGIENVQILISGASISASSDANGYFELPVLSPDVIVFRHMGYRTKKMSPQDLYVSDCPKINMEPVVAELSEVNANRYLAAGISKNASAELIVRPGKFGILPGLTEPDILQAMQQVPGIASMDETVSNINVRGGTHDQNLFLWNGIRMFQTSHFFGLISAFNPFLATNITISKNGSSAFFGESVSSLVDISSHTRVIDSCYNAVAVDMVNANFFSKIRLSNDATFQASGRRTYSDIFTSPTFREYTDRVFQNTIVTDLAQNQQVRIDSDEEFYFYDFSLQYHQKFGRHELIVDGIGIENGVDIVQQTEMASRSSELAQRNFGGSIHWNSQWNDNQRTELETYYSWYRLHSQNEALMEDQETDQRNQVKDVGVRMRHNIRWSEQIDLGLGYQYDAISVTNTDAVNAPPFSRQSTLVSRTHAAIAESGYRSPSGRTQFRAGVRCNYFEKFALLLFEPRLTVSQNLHDKITLELQGERKSQTLSQIIDQQQDFLGIEKRRWTLADENTIPIQKSNQASLGLTYRSNGWLAAVDQFYKHVSGITTGGQGFQNQFEFVDAVGDYRVLGSEVLLQKSFMRFYSWISYSFHRNRYDFESLEPSKFSGLFSARHTVSWAGIYEWNKLRIALGAKWHNGRPYTTPQSFAIDPENPANSQIIYNAPNAQNLPDYVQVNLSASKTWQLGRATLTASGSLLNIFDRNNVINRYYRINLAGNTVEKVNIFSLGRTPNVGLRLIF